MNGFAGSVGAFATMKFINHEFEMLDLDVDGFQIVPSFI